MPGEASGLRMIPCRIAPETARLPPTSAPSRTRGRRMFQMTFAAVCSVSAPKASASTSFMPTEVEPITMPSTAVHPSSTAAETIATTNRLFACKACLRSPCKLVVCISFKIRCYFCSCWSS